MEDDLPEAQPTELPQSDQHLFVSYTARDEKLAKAFIEELQARGIEAWWMKGERTAGAYPIEIDEALDRSSGFVLLHSRHTVGSTGCLQELTSANSMKLPVSVVKLDNAEYTTGYRNQLATATPIYWLSVRDVVDSVLNRLTNAPLPALHWWQRLDRWFSRRDAGRWMNLAMAVVLVFALTNVAIHFDTVRSRGQAALQRVGLFDGPDAKLRGTLTIENLTAGKKGTDGIAVTAGDNLTAILEFENVGEDPLPTTSELTLVWDPLEQSTGMDGSVSGSGGSIEFGMRVDPDFVTTIDGTFTSLGISDNCTANMKLVPERAFVYPGGSDLVDRAILAVAGDPNAGRARVTTTIATYPFGELQPSETARVEVPIRTEVSDSDEHFETGGVVDARIAGRTDSQTTLSATVGDRVDVRATVSEQSCSPAGGSVILRAPISVDKSSLTASVPVVARREGASDETSLGQLTISLQGKARRVSVVPGSTTVAKHKVQPDSCHRHGDQKILSVPQLEPGAPAVVSDGVTQGGVNIGEVQGFTPNDECRGYSQRSIEVRFQLTVE